MEQIYKTTRNQDLLSCVSSLILFISVMCVQSQFIYICHVCQVLYYLCLSCASSLILFIYVMCVKSYFFYICHVCHFLFCLYLSCVSSLILFISVMCVNSYFIYICHVCQVSRDLNYKFKACMMDRKEQRYETTKYQDLLSWF